MAIEHNEFSLESGTLDQRSSGLHPVFPVIFGL